MKKFAIIALMLGLTACSDAPTAERILRQSGYKDIKTTGHYMFGCGRDDTYSTGFVAIAPNGEKVRGVVCSGILKGGTVRLF